MTVKSPPSNGSLNGGAPAALHNNGGVPYESLLPPDLIEDSPQPRSVPMTLFSREERERQMERAFSGLYRWYVARSQQMRNWNPDSSFEWGKMRQDHSGEI